MNALYYASPREEHAVAWLRRSKPKGGWLKYALNEVAYDPHFAPDWRRGLCGFGAIPRSRWVSWRIRPYGNADMNRMHQLALRCIRRNYYFRDLAKKLGKRK